MYQGRAGVISRHGLGVGVGGGVTMNRGGYDMTIARVWEKASDDVELKSTD